MSLCCWVFQFCTGLWLSLVHPNPSPWNPCMVYLPRSTIKSTIFRQKNIIHGWYRILFWKKIRMPETHSAADLQRVSVFQTIPTLHCRHWYLGKHFHPAEAVEGFNPSSLGFYQRTPTPTIPSKNEDRFALFDSLIPQYRYIIQWPLYKHGWFLKIRFPDLRKQLDWLVPWLDYSTKMACKMAWWEISKSRYTLAC